MEQHFFNFQGSAVVGVLAFLGTCLALVVAAIAVAYLWMKQRREQVQTLLLAVLAGVGFYLAVLLGYSFTSRDQALDLYQEKYFCEVDCHLAYSVIHVTRTKTLGSGPAQRTARGLYYVVTVKTRFDKRTISSRRGNFPLNPNPRAVVLFDSDDRWYGPSADGQRAWESAGNKSTPLTQPLRPGESYTTDLVFDLPADANDPRLLMVESDWVTHLLIGHENSFFHKKTSFQLESARSNISQQ